MNLIKLLAYNFFKCSRDIIEKRIMGRMTCEKCNMT